MATKIETMVQKVREYALAHYDQDGWDYLVECYEDAEIAELIGDASSTPWAIERCRKVMQLLDEQRRSVMNEVF